MMMTGKMKVMWLHCCCQHLVASVAVVEWLVVVVEVDTFFFFSVLWIRQAVEEAEAAESWCWHSNRCFADLVISHASWRGFSGWTST